MAYIDNRQKYGRPQAMLWSEDYVPPATSADPLVPPGFEYGSDAALADQSFLILSDHNRSDISMAMERIQNRKRMINGRMRSFHVADKVKISTSWDMLPSRRSRNYSDFRSVFSAAITSAIGNGQTITYIATGTSIKLSVDEYVSITGISIPGYNQTNAKVLSAVQNLDGTTTFTVDGTTTGTATYTNALVTTTNVKNNYVAADEYVVDGGAGGADLLDWYNDHTGSFYVYLSYDNHKNFTVDEYNRLGEYSEVIEMYISDFSYNVISRGANNHDFWNVSVTLEEV